MVAIASTSLLEATDAPPSRLSRSGILSEAWVVFLVTAGVYLALGAWLVFHFGLIDGDALARVANAYYMEFSRDPKLAAVGFVWTPLPSLLVAVFLPLRLVWAPLSTVGFLGNIESALAMAGAVTIALGILRDLGVSRVSRLGLVVAFAAQPLILEYGANGMSEALELLTLMAVLRSLLRWLDNRSTSALVRTGLYLALAYLTRYEALAVGVAVIFVVGVASGLRAWRDTDASTPLPPIWEGSDVAQRSVDIKWWHTATADMALVGAPFTVVVAAWAVLSWAIVGHPFETLTSRYGNTAQVASAQASIAHLTHHQIGHTIAFLGTQLLAVAPVLPLLALLVTLLAWRARQPQLLAPVAVLGAVLAFQWLTFVEGTGFGWLRFQITAIPLTLVLAGILVARASHRTVVRAVATVAAAASVAAGFPATLVALSNPNVSRGEYDGLRPVVERIAESVSAPLQLGVLRVDSQVARYLDRMRLPDGSVLADVGIAFPVVLASSHPRQFVITTDRDFYDALAHPAIYGIRYIIVSSKPAGLDVVQAVYPTIYASGAGIARLVQTFPAPEALAESWRLYAVDGSDQPAPTASGAP